MKDDEIKKKFETYDYSPCGDCNYRGDCDGCKMEIHRKLYLKEVSVLNENIHFLIMEKADIGIAHNKEISELEDGYISYRKAYCEALSHRIELKEKLKIAEDAIDYTLNDMEDPDKAKILLAEALSKLKDKS